MAINVTKPAINLREKLNEVTLETGIKGEELLNSDTSTEARNVLELDTHLFTDFESTGIDDNATSTKLTVADTGIDVTGSVTCDGFTSTGIDDNATSTAITIGANEAVGIGGTPPDAAWTVPAIQLSARTALSSIGVSSYLSSNAYYDGAFKYLGTQAAVLYNQTGSGIHAFKVAPSGTADTAISWTTAMTIANDGDVFAGHSTNNAPWSETGSGGTIKFQRDQGGYDTCLAMSSDKANGYSLAYFNQIGTPSDKRYLAFNHNGVQKGTIDRSSGGNGVSYFTGDDGAIYLGGSANANALDDYETGTFTMSGSPIYDTTCKYIKIGELVTLHGTIKVATGTEKGPWTLSYIPFVCGSYDGAGSIIGATDQSEVGSIRIANGSKDLQYTINQTSVNFDYLSFSITYSTN